MPNAETLTNGVGRFAGRVQPLYFFDLLGIELAFGNVPLGVRAPRYALQLSEGM